MEQPIDQSISANEQQSELFASLLEQYDHQSPQAGQILQATIIQTDKDGILVDVGIKRDILIPAKDLVKIEQATLDSLSAGSQIPVYVLGQSDENGDLQLSLSKGLENQIWEKVEHDMKEGTVLDLDVLGHNRGGLIVRFETLRGFIPYSLVPALQGVRNPKRAEAIKNGLIGKPISVKVVEMDRTLNRLIFSAQAAHEEVTRDRLAELKKGQVVTGKVVKLVDFGAFVDLNGVDGLVHISQLSWKKTQHPSELVKIGDEIEVKVIDVDVERQRVSLSRKALLPGPWQTIQDELKAGDYIEGVVTRLVDFGAFVKLPMGVEGLVHTSQIGYASTQNPQDAIKPGDKVLLKVLDVNPERKRVALSMRQVPLEKQFSWAMEAELPVEHEPQQRVSASPDIEPETQSPEVQAVSEPESVEQIEPETQSPEMQTVPEPESVEQVEPGLAAENAL
jgi:small subunit ribosomal protein S1